MILPINRYYALIRSDADYVGKLLSGSIFDSLGIRSRDYLENVYEGKASKVINHVINGELEKAREIAREEKIVRGVDEFNKIVKNIIKGDRIPVTFAYHASLSKALMITALHDSKLVEENSGFAIYNGEDNFLVVAPTIKALNIVGESRTKFSIGSKECFNDLNNSEYYIPTLSTLSRSYVIYLAHYKYPMYAILSDSEGKMESIAKEVEWISGEDGLGRIPLSLLILQEVFHCFSITV